MKTSIEKTFKLRERETTVRKEIIAGLITFFTMSYILTVNPNTLGAMGMDKAALFTATALASGLGSMLMAFIANIPVAQAPGMCLNGIFASTIVMSMGYSWQFALTAVFLEGILFAIISLCRIREVIINSIPLTLKNAIPVGLGLFITLIGLRQAGIVFGNPLTSFAIGSISDIGVWVALFGLVLNAILLARKVPGAILIGIFVTTIFALLVGVAHLPEGAWISTPPSIAPVFFQFEWNYIFSFDMLLVVTSFLMIDIFDSIGTLFGVLTKADMIEKNGNMPIARRALFADALGATLGAVLGVSTVTAYVESVTGVAAGGRTGLTALTTGVMFILALFLAPLFLIIPAQATAPAMIIVGLYLLVSLLKINLEDLTESFPAFLTIIIMPLTGSIAEGILFGFIGYIFIKLLTGKARELSWPVYIMGAIFLLEFILATIVNTSK